MNHPYLDLEASTLWAKLDVAIGDLVKNEDLEIKTARPFVVGYLVRRLTEEGWAKEPQGSLEDRDG